MAPPNNDKSAALLFNTIAGKQQLHEEMDYSIGVNGPRTLERKEEEVDLISRDIAQTYGESTTLSEKTDITKLNNNTISKGKQVEEHKKDINKIPFGLSGYGKGNTLLEVFEVNIYSRSRKGRKSNIHGTIIIDSGLGTSVIFKRTAKNPYRIMSQGSITLTGPTKASQAYDCVTIEIDIKDGGHEVTIGTLVWNPYADHDDAIYDKQLCNLLKGKNGYALIKWAVFKTAILIAIEIKLPRRPPQTGLKCPDKIKIFGRVDASMTEMPLLKTTLFNMKHNNYTIISHEGSTLPLSKSLVSLPIGRSIKISLDLKGLLPISFKSYRVTSAVVEVTPKSFGDREFSVPSTYGPMSVKVTAYPTFLHPETATAYDNIFR